jgi:hypothetical protein
MTLFVGYDCDFYDSICRVLLYLFGMTICPVCFCLSCMNVFFRYVCVCSVFMSGTTAFVSDMILFVCHDYLSGMIVFVWYDCLVWLCLSCMKAFVRYDCICSVCMSGTTAFVRYDFVCLPRLIVRYDFVCSL